MNIIVGVSGSIAIYKSCDLVRNLTKQSINTHVLMTNTAEKWISPVIFQALTNNHVHTSKKFLDSNMEHITIRNNIELFLIAPATANIIAKLAHGIADDIVTTSILSYKGPKWVAPAMNPNMYENPFVQRNLDFLKKYGIKILEPEQGETVCGEEGVGKMMDINDIEKKIKKLIN